MTAVPPFCFAPVVVLPDGLLLLQPAATSATAATAAAAGSSRRPRRGAGLVRRLGPAVSCIVSWARSLSRPCGAARLVFLPLCSGHFVVVLSRGRRCPKPRLTQRESQVAVGPTCHLFLGARLACTWRPRSRRCAACRT